MYKLSVADRRFQRDIQALTRGLELFIQILEVFPFADAEENILSNIDIGNIIDILKNKSNLLNK